MNNDSWEGCVRFHGHSCPGLAVGYRVAGLAMDVLGIPMERASDEELVCIAESESCAVDAVQYLLSCTLGKGNLLVKPLGKAAYTFYNRKSGEGVRVVMSPLDRNADRVKMMEWVLSAPAEDMMTIKEPKMPMPEKARMFDSICCEQCGEHCREDKIRIQNGQRVCLDCFNPYDRG